MSTPSDPPIRIGVIGAGGIFRTRHLPGLRAIDGVELAAVCNRSEASSEQARSEWGFERIAADWESLVAADDVDAVMIGTWPYTHRAMSVAALEAGKHVFCQARMAMDLPEAEAMHAAAERHPDRVGLICPPPHRMPYEPYLRGVLERGELGEPLEASLVCTNGSNLGELNWRERVEYSGQQALQLGIWAETLIAWLGEYETLSATAATPIAAKPDPERSGADYAIAIPQVVRVQGRLKSGVVIGEHHSGVNPAEPRNELTLVGRAKTLRVRIVEGLMELQASEGGGRFEAVDVPEDQTNPWRVEEEFIAAVRAAERGDDWRALHRDSPDFATGLKYMRKVNAVHRSVDEGRAVSV